MKAAVYRYRDASGALLYIGASRWPEERFQQHIWSRGDQMKEVHSVAFDWFESFDEARKHEVAAIKAENPLWNKAHRSAPLDFCDVDPGVTLKEWLKANNVGQADFSRHIGIGQATVSKLVNGVTMPSLETAVVIESATRGEVKPASWFKARAAKSEAA